MIQPSAGSCACSCDRGGLATGILSDALVLCDDRRGLFSQHAAHLRNFLSDASMAEEDHRRQKAYWRAIGGSA